MARMKARVYGWAVGVGSDCGQLWFDGHDIEFDGVVRCNAITFNIKNDSRQFTVHKSQVTPIKEITITEEDFDKACDKASVISMQISKDAFINLIKTELFKDVK